MACANCSTGKDGKPGGCKSNGGCASGGCNRLNTYDWLSKLDIHDSDEFDIVEVSFSQGSRKSFYHNPNQTRTGTGDRVVVESESGYDIGHISLSGELVRMQMRKKRVKENNILKNVIRRANERDLERLNEARSLEKQTMVRARVIARTLGLEMKIGDVEYQADKRKATFYYTADGRVDFRELIRHYAKEFKVKIEMRQIGARQESARIGGIGSCGRELCCSTWLSDFKTVSTAAARYQNLAINQAKLSGQCGRLKCCLNYELDTYIDALDEFPKKADRLYTEAGMATLVKTDIFKRTMYYCYIQENGIRGKFYPLHVTRVKDILVLNKKGEKPAELMEYDHNAVEEVLVDFESVNDVIELPPEERKRRRKKRRGGKGRKEDYRKRDSKTESKPSDKTSDKSSRNTSKRSSSKSNRYKKSSSKNNGSSSKSNGSRKSNNTNGNVKSEKPQLEKAGVNNKPDSKSSSNSSKSRTSSRRKNRRNRPPKKKE